MQIVSIVIQSWLLVWMSYMGVSKIVGQKHQVELFQTIQLPQWFRVVTGIVQLIGCAGLVIGYWYPRMAAWAGVWIGITMVLACLSHFRVKEPAVKSLPAFITLMLAVAVLILFVDEMPNPMT
ncbi:DoxX family protein [Paenibacillus alkalitolerans]|uniref:DoxX family protein n=1 Tax=Paenibacillus alkalitolerans TaxID=2799335 RepID=UPI0018F7AB11|nr:DoxX family protein [Paenibacillus alkalitolerans]